MAPALRQGQQLVALDRLHESPDNPRTISDERFAALKHALDKDPEMMKARPIIATPDGEIVAGNKRFLALVDLGRTEAETYVAKLTSAQKREWMLRDNQEYGDWVPEDLAALVAAHRDEYGADLALLGFSEPQTEALLRSYDDASHDGSFEPEPKDDDHAHAEIWGVVVECETEDQQVALVEELADRGLEVRALIPA